jgi:hypothetical protein
MFYFCFHGYLVQSSTSKLMQNFELPLEVVMRREKYFRRIIHLFQLYLPFGPANKIPVHLNPSNLWDMIPCRIVLKVSYRI